MQLFCYKVKFTTKISTQVLLKMYSSLAVLAIFLVSRISADTRYTDAEARKKLEAAGISIYSSGGCSDQNNPHCTSLQGIHSECIDGPYGIIAFKRNSGCSITITGGTEVGHASGKICKF